MNNNATNHTQYFGFPLFTGTDKPSVLTDWNGTMEELDNTLEDYRVRISGCEQTTQSFMDRLNVVIGQLNDLVARIQGDENIIEQVGLDIEAVNDALLETNASVKRALEELGDLRTTVTGQGSDISTLQTQTQANTSNISTIQGTISTIQGSVSSLQSSVSTLSASVSSLDSRVTTIEGQIDSFTKLTNTKDIMDIIYNNSAYRYQDYEGVEFNISGSSLGGRNLCSESFDLIDDPRAQLAPSIALALTRLPSGMTEQQFRNQYGFIFAGYYIGEISITDTNGYLNDGDNIAVLNSGFMATSSNGQYPGDYRVGYGATSLKVVSHSGSVFRVRGNTFVDCLPMVKQFMNVSEISEKGFKSAANTPLSAGYLQNKIRPTADALQIFVGDTPHEIPWSDVAGVYQEPGIMPVFITVPKFWVR